jgi:hypothetical protein
VARQVPRPLEERPRHPAGGLLGAAAGFGGAGIAGELAGLARSQTGFASQSDPRVLWRRCLKTPIAQEAYHGTSAVDGMMLLMKKLGGLVLVLLGCLGVAIGFEAGSTGLIAVGVVALAAGVILLVPKIVRRNPG